jgi:transcription elongation factor Elf1
MFTKTLKLNNGQPLHCPFCGFKGASCIVDAAHTKGVVMCDGCEATGPGIDVVAGEEQQSLINRALHSWNERTNHATNSHPDRPLGGLRLCN